MARPKANASVAEKEMDRLDDQFQKFEENVKELTMDRMNEAPKEDVEPQTKLSQKDLAKSKDIYLKPDRTISCREKFNEKYRKDWDFSKEVVNFIAEHKEVIGETIEIWTKPFAGIPAEFWKVPTNKPIWGPRHLAEQIKKRKYHRLMMDESKITSDQGNTKYFGQIVSDKEIQRMDALPVSTRRSVFMGI